MFKSIANCKFSVKHYGWHVYPIMKIILCHAWIDIVYSLLAITNYLYTVYIICTCILCADYSGSVVIVIFTESCMLASQSSGSSWLMLRKIRRLEYPPPPQKIYEPKLGNNSGIPVLKKIQTNCNAVWQVLYQRNTIIRII